MQKILFLIKRGLEHRFLPVVLAALSFIIMLPAINSGLMMDDFIQGSMQLRPEQLPSRLMVSADSGKLSYVLFELFGFSRDKQKMKAAKDYGVLPWWVRDDMKAALWRPFTAFTHWLDYRLFPNLPALMHVHNILWFAAVIFLVAIIYRELLGAGWIAGLAGVLFLLDENTYFPVMFVANRGFVVSLFFGLLCFYTYHKWRSEKSLSAGILSPVFLVLSLLSNEAGVSTFAFLLAYALLQEEGFWFKRILSLLPSVFVIVLWRVIYNCLGYGVSGIGGYIDPGHQPLRFLEHLVGRLMVLLASQLSGQASDVLFAVNSSVIKTVIAAYLVFFAVALIIFSPLLGKNRIARFWFAAMMFAAIPASTVTPTGKNFGFVAAAAFALIAVFVEALVTDREWMPKSHLYKITAYLFCIVLLTAHIPGAIASRMIASKTTPLVFGTLSRLGDIGASSDIDNRDVVVVNAPCQLALSTAPFYKAYNSQNIPRTIRALSPGCITLQVTRADDKTLVITSSPVNIFSCDQRSLLHFSYIFNVLNHLFLGDRSFQKGERYNIENLTIEIRAVDGRQLPTEVAFQFDYSLNDPNLYWLQFNWRRFSYDRFEVPQIGQTVSIPGPVPVTFSDALRYLFTGASGRRN